MTFMTLPLPVTPYMIEMKPTVLIHVPLVSVNVPRPPAGSPPMNELPVVSRRPPSSVNVAFPPPTRRFSPAVTESVPLARRTAPFFTEKAPTLLDWPAPGSSVSVPEPCFVNVELPVPPDVITP